MPPAVSSLPTASGLTPGVISTLARWACRPAAGPDSSPWTATPCRSSCASGAERAARQPGSPLNNLLVGVIAEDLVASELAAARPRVTAVVGERCVTVRVVVMSVFWFSDIEGSTRLWASHPDQTGNWLAKWMVSCSVKASLHS